MNGGLYRLFQPGRRKQIPAFAGMTPSYHVIPAQAGIQTTDNRKTTPCQRPEVLVKLTNYFKQLQS